MRLGGSIGRRLSLVRLAPSFFLFFWFDCVVFILFLGGFLGNKEDEDLVWLGFLLCIVLSSI